jgi:three-Cys-motif partner protein
VHQFGGEWTGRKLAIVQEYAALYTAALREQFEKLIYIDAFAGTGSRLGSAPGISDIGGLMSDPGSAQIALACTPGFDEFVFIDRKRSHVEALEQLKTQFPEKADSISVYCADCNEKLRELAGKLEWGWKRRGLVFLDP